MATRASDVERDRRHRYGVPLEARDAALIVAPLLVLTAVFTLPASVKHALVLSHPHPTLWALYTEHYVHFSLDHFLNDATAYVILAPTAYLLFAWAGDRAFFRRAFLAVLLAYPPVLSLLDLALPRRVVTYGFSGLVMALFGLVGVAAVYYLTTGPGDVALTHAPGLFFAVTTAIPLLVLPPTTLSLALAGASALLTVHYAVAFERALPRDALRALVHRPGAAELPGFAGALVVVSPFAAFPPHPTAGPVSVDIFLHFLGFALGFLGPYVALVRRENTA